MDVRFTRRSALAAGLGAPLSLLGGRQARADRPGGGCVYSSGYFQVPTAHGVLIGLLLPAVQNAREAAQLLLVGSDGTVVATFPIAGAGSDRGPIAAFFDVFFAPPTDANQGVRTLVIQERGSQQVILVPGSDGILIGLLLPAVQRDGESPGMLAGATLFSDEAGNLTQILPYIEQDFAGREVESPGPSFVGPWIAPSGDSSIIGVLLPAVQRASNPHSLVLIDSAGGTITRVSLLPAVQSGPRTSFFDVFLTIDWGDGKVTVNRVFADGSVRTVGGGASVDGILIGLLLPAVQSNGKPVGMLGGSLTVNGRATGFQPSAG